MTGGSLNAWTAVSANAKILILKLITTYKALWQHSDKLCLLMQRY